MNNPKPVNALKDPEHRKNVYITMTALVLMFFCFTACNYIMDHHYETRYQAAFLIAGACYFLTVLGMIFDNGIAEHH